MRKGDLVTLAKGTSCWRSPTRDDLEAWHKKWAHIPTDDGEIRLPPRVLIVEPPATPLIVLQARARPPFGARGGWCLLLDPTQGHTIWAKRDHCNLV